ncbi:lysophospholipid acyltransferase family protein [Mucilaginibacter auburnensis]|uniref:KDO2-lipid IV(A) lauroyltransferase n=1 Tax=Mucilaginibacter auburnensis TaxID=1457233 RepID=A0A2H9VLJ0_9SPHI|nr:lysophospholipid acyltransferase family protein [Mucilaginibacter auburnensis]PJJ79183.1 KDO2-lipid IV(A) lauroyltransferase [Mucilaginibacter auburnensis]
MLTKILSKLGIAMLYLISFLPFWLLYKISDLLFIVLYHVMHYRRDVVQANLRNSFPEKNGAELKVIEKEYYSYLADLSVETVKLFTISEKEVMKRMRCTNFDLIQGYFAQGKSVIGALGHYGNWELAAHCLSLLTQTERRIIVYKPLTNKTFDNAFIKVRSRFGATLVAMQNTMRTLVSYKKETTISVLVSDQTPVQSEANYFTEFLNQPTAVFLGVEKLSKLLNNVVVFCDIRRIKRGYYTVTFVPLFDDAKNTAEYEITREHVRYLENVIKQEPAYWLWSHKRWKFTPPHSN